MGGLARKLKHRQLNIIGVANWLLYLTFIYPPGLQAALREHFILGSRNLDFVPILMLVKAVKIEVKGVAES